jgi:multiple sugar transport system ATP-binding protein
MKDGYVQQVAAPQTLYEEPANLFVATFIGTPPMNTAEGRILDEGGRTWLIFSDNNAKVALPDDKGRKENVLTYNGHKVMFGIRPNFIYAEQEFIDAHPDMVINAYVELTELLGAETNLYFSVGGLQFTSVVPTGSINCKMGDTIQLAIDTTKVHLFDPEDERTITN